MAWLEIHQSLWTHRKTLRLAIELNIPTAHAGGLMAHFWCWALDNAPDGNITDLSPFVVATAAGWKKDPQKFYDAVLVAGFFYHDETGVRIHDWASYTGRLIEKRKQESERSARKRDLYGNENLIKMVRARDGDRCRYCGRIVRWNDRKGPGGGTYDHVDPDGRNVLENIVVACRSCNARKRDRRPDEAGMPLLPPHQPDICPESVRNLPEINQTVPNQTVPYTTRSSSSASTEDLIFDVPPGVPRETDAAAAQRNADLDRIQTRFAQITGRLQVNPLDYVAIKESLDLAGGDADRVLAIMNTIAERRKNRTDLQPITSFAYFRRAVEGEIDLQRAKDQARAAVAVSQPVDQEAIQKAQERLAASCPELAELFEGRG